MADIADGGHLLVVDTHHVLAHLQVLPAVPPLLELVVVSHGVRLEGRLRPESLSVSSPALSDRGTPEEKYSLEFLILRVEFVFMSDYC